MTSCGSSQIIDEGFRNLHVDLNPGELGFRCNPCNKLLAKPNANGETAGQIKCPRCGTLNER